MKTCNTPSIPHVTAKFAGCGRAFGAEHYALRRSVNETLLGKLFTVQIIGLVITPRTIGARVKLPNDEVIRHLWAADDQEVVFPGLYINLSFLSYYMKCLNSQYIENL